MDPFVTIYLINRWCRQLLNATRSANRNLIRVNRAITRVRRRRGRVNLFYDPDRLLTSFLLGGVVKVSRPSSNVSSQGVISGPFQLTVLAITYYTNLIASGNVANFNRAIGGHKFTCVKASRSYRCVSRVLFFCNFATQLLVRVVSGVLRNTIKASPVLVCLSGDLRVGALTRRAFRDLTYLNQRFFRDRALVTSGSAFLQLALRVSSRVSVSIPNLFLRALRRSFRQVKGLLIVVGRCLLARSFHRGGAHKFVNPLIFVRMEEYVKRRIFSTLRRRVRVRLTRNKSEGSFNLKRCNVPNFRANYRVFLITRVCLISGRRRQGIRFKRFFRRVNVLIQDLRRIYRVGRRVHVLRDQFKGIRRTFLRLMVKLRRPKHVQRASLRIFNVRGARSAIANNLNLRNNGKSAFPRRGIRRNKLTSVQVTRSVRGANFVYRGRSFV